MRRKKDCPYEKGTTGYDVWMSKFYGDRAWLFGKLAIGCAIGAVVLNVVALVLRMMA